jgi:hypothetical protein
MADTGVSGDVFAVAGRAVPFCADLQRIRQRGDRTIWTDKRDLDGGKEGVSV